MTLHGILIVVDGRASTGSESTGELYRHVTYLVAIQAGLAYNLLRSNLAVCTLQVLSKLAMLNNTGAAMNRNSTSTARLSFPI